MLEWSGAQGEVPVVDFGFSKTQTDHKRTYPMSTIEQLIKARLGVLARAREVGNVRFPRA